MERQVGTSFDDLVEGGGGVFVLVVCHLDVGEAYSVVHLTGNSLGEAFHGSLLPAGIGGKSVELGQREERRLTRVCPLCGTIEFLLDFAETAESFVDSDETRKEVGVVVTFKVDQSESPPCRRGGPVEVADKFVEAVQLDESAQLLPRIAGGGEGREDVDGGFCFSGLQKEGDNPGPQGDVFRKGGEEFIPVGDCLGELSLDAVEGGFAQADGDALVVREGDDFDEASVERESLSRAFLLISDLGEGFEGMETSAVGFKDGVIQRPRLFDLPVLAKEVSIKQLRHRGSRGVGSAEVVEQQSGLVLPEIEVPEKIEYTPVGGILLEELNVVIGEPGICFGPPRRRARLRFGSWELILLGKER